jgi:phosphoribosylformylglycinamidine synthase
VAPRIGVVVVPGTNCEHDVIQAVERLGAEGVLLWHGDATIDSIGSLDSVGSVSSVDAVVLPGGFAHGDYLRPGALARFSPIMDAITRFAREGGPVVGICNGFQVLTEAGLLPGALQKNGRLRFLCQPTRLVVASTASVLTGLAEVGQELVIPINHFSGSFTCDEETLRQLREGDRIVLRYLDNPNGSVDDIAGIVNEAGNVVGLMPHPERASDALLGSEDGLVLLRSLLAAAGAGVAA